MAIFETELAVIVRRNYLYYPQLIILEWIHIFGVKNLHKVNILKMFLLRLPSYRIDNFVNCGIVLRSIIQAVTISLCMHFLFVPLLLRHIKTRVVYVKQPIIAFLVQTLEEGGEEIL